MLQPLEGFDRELAALLQDLLDAMKAKWRRPLEVDLVLVALGDDLMICRCDEVARRIIRARQLRKWKPSIPFVTSGVAGHRKQARPSLPQRSGTGGLPPDIAIHIRIHK